MNSVKMCIIPNPSNLAGSAHGDVTRSDLHTFWTDFWFHITLPVRAELAPTAVRRAPSMR